VATLPDPTTEVQVGFADDLAGAAFGMALACEVPFVAEWIGPTPADAAEAADLLNQGDAGDAEPPSDARMPFADWLACQASWYRSFGTEAADYLAGLIDGHAGWARTLGAQSPADLAERLALIDDWRDERLSKGGAL
jgi:hypothetical protein